MRSVYDEKMDEIIQIAVKRQGGFEKKVLETINPKDAAIINYEKIRELTKEEKFKIIFLYLTGEKIITKENEKKFKKFRKMAEEDLEKLHCGSWGNYSSSFKKFSEKIGMKTEYRQVRIPSVTRGRTYCNDFFFFSKNYQGGKSQKVIFSEINPIFAIAV